MASTAIRNKSKSGSFHSGCLQVHFSFSPYRIHFFPHNYFSIQEKTASFLIVDGSENKHQIKRAVRSIIDNKYTRENHSIHFQRKRELGRCSLHESKKKKRKSKEKSFAIPIDLKFLMKSSFVYTHGYDIDQASEQYTNEPGIDVDMVEKVFLLIFLMLNTSNESGHIRCDTNN